MRQSGRVISDDQPSIMVKWWKMVQQQMSTKINVRPTEIRTDVLLLY